ncbi:MAG: hypothetical protein J6B34_04280 [Clostridia bacterium]|nr:hypothetical protein [Clostridia bacterium]
MKRAITLILALLMCISLVSCSSNTDAPEGMMLASNTAVVDYSLFVPQGWIIDLNGATTAAHVSDGDRTSVNVAQWNYQGTIDDWWKLEYKAQSFDSDAVFKDVKILTVNEETGEEGESCLIGGAGAKRYEYTARLGDAFFKYIVIATVTRGSIYVMHFTFMQDSVAEGAEITYSQYDNHKEDVKKIIDSFRFN